jgi:hypothetical protein
MRKRLAEAIIRTLQRCPCCRRQALNVNRRLRL